MLHAMNFKTRSSSNKDYVNVQFEFIACNNVTCLSYSPESVTHVVIAWNAVSNVHSWYVYNLPISHMAFLKLGHFKRNKYTFSLQFAGTNT